jgi:hypothetical protein
MRPDTVYRRSALWEVSKYPGLLLAQVEGWQFHYRNLGDVPFRRNHHPSPLDYDQSKTIAQKLADILREQSFTSRRQALQALQAADQMLALR